MNITPQELNNSADLLDEMGEFPDTASELREAADTINFLSQRLREATDLIITIDGDIHIAELPSGLGGSTELAYDIQHFLNKPR